MSDATTSVWGSQRISDWGYSPPSTNGPFQSTKLLAQAARPDGATRTIQRYLIELLTEKPEYFEDK